MGTLGHENESAGLPESSKRHLKNESGYWRRGGDTALRVLMQSSFRSASAVLFKWATVGAATADRPA